MVDTFSVIALVAVSAQLGLRLSARSSDYVRPRREAISDYGVGDYSGWFWGPRISSCAPQEATSLGW
jgi:hypothetical protein